MKFHGGAGVTGYGSGAGVPPALPASHPDVEIAGEAYAVWVAVPDFDWFAATPAIRWRTRIRLYNNAPYALSSLSIWLASYSNQYGYEELYYYESLSNGTFTMQPGGEEVELEFVSDNAFAIPPYVNVVGVGNERTPSMGGGLFAATLSGENSISVIDIEWEPYTAPRPIHALAPLQMGGREILDSRVEQLVDLPTPTVSQKYRVVAHDGALKWCDGFEWRFVNEIYIPPPTGYQGDYDYYTSYAPGSIVVYKDEAWGTTTYTSPGVVPGEGNSDWEYLGDIPTPPDGGFEGVWTTGRAYPAGSIVTHGGKTWGSVTAPPAGVPPGTAAGGFPALTAGADVFEGATEVYVASTGATVTSPVFSNAAYPVDDPYHYVTSGYTSPRVAWWRYAPLSSGNVTFTTEDCGSDTILFLQILNPDDPSYYALIGAAADYDSGPGPTSTLIYPVLAGTVYYISVYISNGSIGNYSLKVKNARATAPFTGSSWVDLGSSSVGVTDHGALTGLADPDHPISAVQGLQAALDSKANLTQIAYRHVQDVPASTWVITHVLPFRPNVEVRANVSGSGLVSVLAEVSWPSDTQVQVVLAQTVTGECYLS